jgi:hypothetical protein
MLGGTERNKAKGITRSSTIEKAVAIGRNSELQTKLSHVMGHINDAVSTA